MSDTQKPRVDFIGIGVSKCGSSWIYANLHAHPEICLSSQKETNFFRKNFYKGWTWYAGLFCECTPEKTAGEYSPGYLQDKNAIDRIAQYYTNAKLIISLRDPIDRLRSVWKFNYARGIHNYVHFDDYIANISPEELKKGLYGQQIEYTLQHFDSNQLHVVIYDDIKEKPEMTLRDLYRFLSVDDSFLPETYNRRVRAAFETQPKFRLINNALFEIRSTTTKLAPVWFVRSLKKVGLNNAVKSVLRWNRTRDRGAPELDDVLSEKTYSHLRSYYIDDIKKLSTILNRDLITEWQYEDPV